MFLLVADIERYPQFVPLCQRLLVRGRETQEDGTEILIADMTVAYGPVHETFVTKVVTDPENLTIRASYIDGPFSHLDNKWSFEEKPNNDQEPHSTVHFDIDYEFKSRTLGMLMGTMFDRAFRKFAEAFETRADELYDAGPLRQA